MTSLEEPALHALSVEPRAARAGETVRIVFRTRNLGTAPSPAGTVAFALGEGLEPLDELEAAVEPVAPGEDVVAAIRARVAAPAEDRSEIAVRAALHLPDRVLGTNACTVVVRSRAVLDGPASGTYVEQLDAEMVRVRAVVCNEGDGPAHGVRVIVPPPIGCVRADGDAPAVLELHRMEPGQCAEVAFGARIVEPALEICADDGEVRFGDGRRVALPARETVTLQPALAPPRAVVTPSRRRVDLAVDVINAGWVDARAVRVRATLPGVLRLVEGSVVVDGMPVGGRAGRRRARRSAHDAARLECAGEPVVVELSAVPARSTVRVALSAVFPPEFTGGTLVVGVGEHEVGVPVVPELVHDVRVRVLDAPRTVSPGDLARVRAEVVNAGDVAERLAVTLTDACSEAPIVVQPGSMAGVELMVRVPDDLCDGMTFAPAVLVSDAGAQRASARCALHVRDRAWLAVDEPPMHRDGHVAYSVRNGGSTPAQDVAAVFGDVGVPLGDLEPGSTAVCTVDEALAHAGGTISCARGTALPLPRLDDRLPPAFYARLGAPRRVVAGAAFAVRLEIDVEDPVDRLTIQVPEVTGFRYAAGSASLDGRTLLDRCERVARARSSPLDGEGLILRDVPAGTRLTAEWSLIADEPLDEASLRASVGADGDGQHVGSAGICVHERDLFAEQRAGLPYHVESCVVVPQSQDTIERETFEPFIGESLAETPTTPVGILDDLSLEGRACLPLADAAQPLAQEALEAPCSLRETPALRYTLRLDHRRTEEIARLRYGTDTDGLAGHLFALRFFFPDGHCADNAAIAAALEALESAVRDTFDRLYVKLRIPGFDVSSDDLEDRAVRDALIALYEAVLAAAPAQRLRRTLEACAEASYGAPVVLRALVALIPRRCDDDPAFGDALAAYAALLDGALSRYEGLPLELFDDALAHGRDGALDDAREQVFAALRASVTPLETAC
jgi:hypothetical protein